MCYRLSSNVSSLFSGIDLSNVVTFITYGFFFVFILYGQRIQFYVAEQSVTRSLKKLSRDEGYGDQADD